MKPQVAKKRIVIDLGKITTPYCGLAETSLNFTQALESLRSQEFEFFYIVPQALKEIFAQQVGANRMIVPAYSGLRKVLFYICGKKSLLCKIPNFDLYHYLHFYSPWGFSGKEKKQLLTVHDFHALERNRSKKRMAKKIEQVGMLAFISNFTFAEYQKHFDNLNKKTCVIKNGVKAPGQIKQSNQQDLLGKYGSFLFTLGGLKRKNIHSLLAMMQHLKKEDDFSRLKLLVAGKIKTKYKNELLNEIQQRDLNEQVIFLGTVSEQKKHTLLSICKAFVFPSLQEGFGLPIVEAMHFGKPVFCSNKTSLPEVGGEMAYYWENFEPEYMATIFKEGLHQYSLNKDEFIKARKKYACKFDWVENAQAYIDYYRDILHMR